MPIGENAAQSRDPQEYGMKEETDICIRLGSYLTETITNLSRADYRRSQPTHRGALLDFEE
jgi:hypothetical protein